MSVPSEMSGLQDEEVGTVSFVRDYVELGFDGPVLRLLGRLSVLDDLGAVEDGDVQFEHRLRKFIGLSLTSLAERADGAELTFGDGRRLQLFWTGPELMHFMARYGGPLVVW